jgi:hypothetical protein
MSSSALLEKPSLALLLAGQNPRSFMAATANPSIERTSQRLRLCAAAHVER